VYDLTTDDEADLIDDAEHFLDGGPLVLAQENEVAGHIPKSEEASDRSAVERIATAELDTLSQVELLERLAIAMARRQEEIDRAAARPSSPEAHEIVAVPDPEPVYDLAPAFEPEVQQADAPVYEDAEYEPVACDEPDDQALTGSEPEFPAEPEFEEAPASPIEEPEIAATVAEPAPAALRVPAALRPVALGSYEDEEDEALPGYVPPRHIGMMPKAAEAPFAPPAAMTADFDESEEDGEGEDEETLEEGYSSLLNLSRPAAPRQQFVRIEEAEYDSEIQPVVVFPGEEGGEAAHASASSPARADDGQAAVDDADRRPFDAPSRIDAEETERALRAALATLQRMSGAA
jgi:hypothetical protein